MPDIEPIVTSVCLQRIAKSDVTGEHSLMAQELIVRRDMDEYIRHAQGCYAEFGGGYKCTCGFDGLMQRLEPFLRTLGEDIRNEQ